MLNYESQEFKSLEELREIAPSIFTQVGSESTSDKYTHIPTDQVIKDMELLGWNVVDAKEVQSRKESTNGFQKHLVVFRNNDVVINGEDGDTVYPQVLLTNSHDGKNSFQFTAGLFRMICENGLVIATDTFEDVKIRHMGYDFSTLQDTRVEGTENTFDDQAIEEVLEAQRKADEGNMLWEVFNRVQENIIEGNFEYITKTGKKRQARVIKNFKQDQDVNKKMFSKALEFVA